MNQEVELSQNFAVTVLHLKPTHDVYLEQIGVLLKGDWPRSIIEAEFVVVGAPDSGLDRFRCEVVASRPTFWIIRRECYNRSQSQ
jgi:hypothetical protein